MSQNLNLTFEAHEFQSSKKEELRQAAIRFLANEGLNQKNAKIEFTGNPEYLIIQTIYPVVVSGSQIWLAEVAKNWKNMVQIANMQPCDAFITADEVAIGRQRVVTLLHTSEKKRYIDALKSLLLLPVTEALADYEASKDIVLYHGEALPDYVQIIQRLKKLGVAYKESWKH